VKVIKKISKKLVDIQKAGISASIPDKSSESRDGSRVDGGAGVSVSGEDNRNARVPGQVGHETEWKSTMMLLEDELNDAGNEATRALKEKQREMIDALDLRKWVLLRVILPLLLVPDQM